MNYLQRLIQEVRVLVFVSLLLNNILLFSVWYLTKDVWKFQFSVIVFCMLFSGLFFNFLLERFVSKAVTQPIQLLWRNIFHLSSNEHGRTSVPRLTTIWLGKDLVAALTGQVYQLAMVTTSEQAKALAVPDIRKNFIASSLPLPLIILDRNEVVRFANNAAQRYLGLPEAELVGQNFPSKVIMQFAQNEQDFHSWLQGVQTDAATSTQLWNDVRIERPEEQGALRFDMAAFYNKDNPEGIETMLLYFDHSDRYAARDAEVDFVALAVHELRAPVTMLRGYIEALDEELQDQLSGETKDFFNKMKASSVQLVTFINNILNVARIEGNQLEVQLQEENWSEVVESVAAELRLRTEVRGLRLEVNVPPDLPTVAVDRFSISQVITNLVDNAIKYSAGKGDKIVLSVRVIEGTIETTVIDSGVGIPENVVATLFKKFQRNFHNRANISGTGLGLYLSKLIVDMHGGNIWVSSKEGKGTTVGFTVLTFASLSDEQKNVANNKIIRSSHGWIKNHHMSRR